jgi:hypothetical protein
MASNNTLPMARLTSGVPVLGPVGIGFSLGTAWQQVLAFDAVRRGVIFANPSSDTIYVAPANLSGQQIAGAVAIFPQEEWDLFADPPISVNTAWMAWAATGPASAFTVLNFTDQNVLGSPNNANGPLPQSNLSFDVPIVSPLATGISLATSSVTAIGSNPVRRGIAFHNPGLVPVAVCPANLSAAFGPGSIIVLPGATKRIFAKGNVKVNCGFNAIAQSGSNNPLTVLEYV